jgi:hypothetical protein
MTSPKFPLVATGATLTLAVVEGVRPRKTDPSVSAPNAPLAANVTPQGVQGILPFERVAYLGAPRRDRRIDTGVGSPATSPCRGAERIDLVVRDGGPQKEGPARRRRGPGQNCADALDRGRWLRLTSTRSGKTLCILYIRAPTRSKDGARAAQGNFGWVSGNFIRVQAMHALPSLG